MDSPTTSVVPRLTPEKFSALAETCYQCSRIGKELLINQTKIRLDVMLAKSRYHSARRSGEEGLDELLIYDEIKIRKLQWDLQIAEIDQFVDHVSIYYSEILDIVHEMELADSPNPITSCLARIKEIMGQHE
jgi:hypothetical protein